MHIRELYPDVIAEDLDYEYKQVLNPDNPVKWAKTIVGYANGNYDKKECRFGGGLAKIRLPFFKWV